MTRLIYSSGDQLKIWVRAQDVLGNTKMDSTIVTTDFTEPITSSADDNSTTYIVENTNVKPFNYSSRYLCILFKSLRRGQTCPISMKKMTNILMPGP
jgi:hypothetical protein